MTKEQEPRPFNTVRGARPGTYTVWRWRGRKGWQLVNPEVYVVKSGRGYKVLWYRGGADTEPPETQTLSRYLQGNTRLRFEPTRVTP